MAEADPRRLSPGFFDHQMNVTPRSSGYEAWLSALRRRERKGKQRNRPSKYHVRYFALGLEESSKSVKTRLKTYPRLSMTAMKCYRRGRSTASHVAQMWLPILTLFLLPELAAWTPSQTKSRRGPCCTLIAR